jgi:hypothetical protein
MSSSLLYGERDGVEPARQRGQHQIGTELNGAGLENERRRASG